MITVGHLRAIRYFTDLDEGALAGLAGHVSTRRFARGDTIVLEGEPCEGLFFVLDGRVKLVKTAADGREQVLKLLGRGTTFNDVPAFDGGPTPGTIVAMEPTTVGVVPRARLLALLDRHPRLARTVIAVLAARLRAMTMLVEDLALRGVVARVAKLLLDCGRGGSAIVEGPETVCVPLTQQDIAAMTGSVREVVQRAVKLLEREGAIRTARGRITILDAGVLETLAGTRVPGA